MNNIESSGLRLYSIGIVVEDKERNSSVIRVYPVEVLPFTDGEVSKSLDIKTNVTSHSGQVGSSITRENTIYAKWAAIGSSNRATPPDVIKNESVIILRHNDSDDFYWTDWGFEPQLRRKETAVYVFGNTDKYGPLLDSTNSYWMKVSSHDKEVALFTNKNDGELTTYEVKIDTKNGNLNIRDGKKNEIVLDSSRDTLRIFTNEKVEVTANNIIANASSVTVNASSISLNGNVSIGGNLNVSSNVNVGGVVSAKDCNC